ncbi:hypothetical protein EW093_13800 [Thiospirochaeta perfilievii]|uniref:DUF3996 domain-containing protein n=1 Tax=Thiospirochaeta perfilievii TaxID=252967 RepID=A0A5C1QCA3_9SPIO|nr:hypothetical protein [Thiospirochaeta perfilievii]QEN05735.1 hypothetical protein EW093_13800 [Thiospirochaeta perfilievii]
MKKLSLLIITSIFVGTSSLFSLGLGIQGNINAGEFFAPGVALSLKLDSVPFYFAFNWQFEEEVKNFSLTSDYWALNKTMLYVNNQPLNLFFGLGAYCNVTIDQSQNGDYFQPSLGLRIPVGINMYILDRVLEPFIQVAPSFGIHFIPSLGADTVYWPLSVGIRMWL